MSAETLEVIAQLLRALSFVILYVLVGFGPGFIVGVLLANRTIGRRNPLRMDKHQEAIEQAAEHNKQWRPDDPRWQK